jgi:hypothetical protein
VRVLLCGGDPVSGQTPIAVWSVRYLAGLGWQPMIADLMSDSRGTITS